MPEERGADDGDFHGYVGARWPALVRTLVLLGCPQALAPDVVATGLAQCRRGWRAAVEHDDLDVVVHRAVLGAWDDRLRGPWWAGLRPPSDADWPGPDLSALDRLTPEVRAGLVLRRYTGLDPAQAVAVAGREAGGPLPHAPDAPALRAAGDGVVVFSLPDADVTAEPPWWRRRSVLAVAGVVVLALVLGLWTWLADDGSVDEDDRADPFSLDAVEPGRSANPAEVAWYADDVVHLANATYALTPTLRDLVVIGAGAVYGDRDGRVVHLADDGSRRLLGTKDPTVPLVSSDDLGWVAWVDPAGPNPRLLVYDVARADLVGELDLPPSTSGPQELPDTRPVAIDQQAVYFQTSEGSRAWRPTREPNRVELIEGDLVEVASANRIFQVDPRRIGIDQPFFNVVYLVDGRGAELSLDGNYVVTRSPDDGAVLVYDTRSGEPVDVAPPEDLNVVDVVLAPERSITYLTVNPDGFATQEGNDSTPLQGELVTCPLDGGECEALASFVLDSEAPLLAR